LFFVQILDETPFVKEEARTIQLKGILNSSSLLKGPMMTLLVCSVDVRMVVKDLNGVTTSSRSAAEEEEEHELLAFRHSASFAVPRG